MKKNKFDKIATNIIISGKVALYAFVSITSGIALATKAITAIETTPIFEYFIYAYFILFVFVAYRLLLLMIARGLSPLGLWKVFAVDMSIENHMKFFTDNPYMFKTLQNTPTVSIDMLIKCVDKWCDENLSGLYEMKFSMRKNISLDFYILNREDATLFKLTWDLD